MNVDSTPRVPPVARAVYLPGKRVGAADQQRYLGRVEAGLVAVIHHDSRGDEAVIDLRGTGSTLGEHSLFAQEEPNALVLEALVPTRIHWFDSASVAGDSSARVLAVVMSVLAARTRRQQERMCRRRLQSASQQVAQLLVDTWPQTTHDSDGSALEHLSRFDMARIIGTNRSSVSTICADLERRGWCRQIGHPGAEVDLVSLRAYAGRGLSSEPDQAEGRLLQHQRSLWDLVQELPAVATQVSSRPRNGGRAPDLASLIAS